MQKIVSHLLLAIALFTSACDKDENPFAGADHHVVSFTLSLPDTVLRAAIIDSAIVLAAPDNLSLAGASATVTLSENAAIYPDPATITAWDNDALFTVIGADGTRGRYTYTVRRGRVETGGGILLETQADVDAFGARGFTAISGNLVIGRPVGADSITSLAPLASLREVDRALVLLPTCAAADLTGLDNLATIGELRADGLRHLATIELPRLRRAGRLYIRNAPLANVDLPALADVEGELYIHAPLAALHLPNLRRVGGAFTLIGANATIARLACPALEEAGEILFSTLNNVTKVDLPSLKRADALTFNGLGMLSVLLAPALESVGIFTAPTTVYFSELALPALTRVTRMRIDCKNLRVLDLPRLETVDEQLYISGTLLDGIGGLTALERAAEILLYDLPEMRRLALPPSLQRVETLVVYNRLTAPLDEIDVRGLNIGELRVMSNGIRAKIIGDDIFRGTLTIDAQSAAYVTGEGYPGFPRLEGFREVDSLSLGAGASYMDTVRVRGIREIHRGFRVYSNSIKRLAMPDLERVGGDFHIASLQQVVDETIELERLAVIGGDFTFTAGSPATRTARFPALRSVGGAFTVFTRNGYGGYSLQRVLFPVLERVGGKLRVAGESGYTNTLLENLDGFAALRSAAAIEVTGQMAIQSFAGLQEAFKAIDADGWVVSGNNYNPSYQDMLDGLWTKP